MSVLIKGMKMPCMCSDCDFCSGLYIPSDKYICECPTSKEMDISRAIDEDCRHPDCPLVEVPDKHGRLIDADACIDYISNNDQHAWEALAYAPTVIEAEGEE